MGEAMGATDHSLLVGQGIGAHCYVAYQYSFCHGWASGPTAWLSQHVLGVKPVEPGSTRVVVSPKLGHLRWAEGSYPTPLGPILFGMNVRRTGRSEAISGHPMVSRWIFRICSI